MRAETETPTQLPPELYLVLETGATATDRLRAALQTTAVATVLLAPPPGGSLEPGGTKALIELAQAADVAVLIADDARLARTLRADGVHLTHTDTLAADYEDAREILGTRAIVGVHAGKSRHDAMELAEAGADYIAFGAPAFAQDRAAAEARRHELIAWWAEIFEIPCVAFDVATAAEAGDLAAVGVDFLAVPLPAGLSVAETVERLRAIRQAAGEPTGFSAA